MSSALLAALFAILGTGLAITSTACFLLWRKVRALTSAESPVKRVSPGRKAATVSLALSPLQPEKKLAKARDEVARRLDDLASRHIGLEARLAKIEASTTETGLVIASVPGGPRGGRRVDSGHSATSEGPTLISVPNLASPPTANSEAAAELDRRFGPIWAMADEGTPAEAISRETGYPIGQVELILGLRRRLLVGGAGVDG